MLFGRGRRDGQAIISHTHRLILMKVPGKEYPKFSWKRCTFLFQPLTAALLSSVFFFVIVFVFFRPGYAIDDDIAMISVLSGYLGGKPLPFLIYSNVLLGLFLNPFYEMAPKINWEVLFFIGINFFTVWVLIYTFLSRLPSARMRWFATSTVLLCDVYFITNISYTMIAALAATAGLCLIVTAIQSPLVFKKNITAYFGLALVLTSSLIRLKAMLMMGVLSLPLLFLFFYPTRLKKYPIVFSLLILSVGSAYLFDNYYVRSAPAWQSFRIYDAVRSDLHDTPRNKTVTPEIAAQVGWSKNDLNEFFYNWFFPDQQIYSLENLQYLVNNIPDQQGGGIKRMLTAFVFRLSSLAALPYYLLFLSIWLSLLFSNLAKRASYACLALMVIFFALGFYLSLAMKFPDRILLPLCAGIVIFGLYILTWSGKSSAGVFFQARQNLTTRRLYFASMAIILTASFGLVLTFALNLTKINIQNQVAYQNILVDLRNLQDRGLISTKALIISPSFGFPFEWANPLSINFPEIQVLDMGWLTFSPAYEQVLHDFDAQAMPEALYEQKNVYIMTSKPYLKGILEFIKEHKRLDVNAIALYQIPNSAVRLYKLQQIKPPGP